MYNKDAVIEFLLDKSADKTPMEAASHIKSLKVKGLTLRSATKFKVLQDLNWLVISLPMKIAKTKTCSGSSCRWVLCNAAVWHWPSRQQETEASFYKPLRRLIAVVGRRQPYFWKASLQPCLITSFTWLQQRPE